MRQTTAVIGGREYPMRFSLRVVTACWERYGSLETMFRAIRMRTAEEEGLGPPVEECLWVLDGLLDAGQRYNRLNGLETAEPPDRETLLDTMDMADLQRVVLSAISADSARTVEADPPKNGGGGEDHRSS